MDPTQPNLLETFGYFLDGPTGNVKPQRQLGRLSVTPDSVACGRVEPFGEVHAGLRWHVTLAVWRVDQFSHVEELIPRYSSSYGCQFGVKFIDL